MLGFAAFSLTYRASLTTSWPCVFGCRYPKYFNPAGLSELDTNVFNICFAQHEGFQQFDHDLREFNWTMIQKVFN